MPDPLPGAVSLHPATHRRVAEAAAEVGRLDGLAATLSNTLHITRPAVRREALATSALEGTFSTLTELMTADLAGEVAPASAVREVLNYIEATNRGIAAVEVHPVSVNLLLELHEVLLSGTRHDHAGGRIRESLVGIGRPGAGIDGARFVPPPPTEVVGLLNAWERWNYARSDLHPIARIALSHYQFETIHPFLDGNGRIGRLAVVLLLIEAGMIGGHYLSLSARLEPRKDEYIDHLAAVSESGDFDPWVSFFAEVLAEEAAAAGVWFKRLLAWREDMVSQLRSGGRRGLVVQLAEWLAEQPVVTARAVADHFDVAFQSANRAIATLVDREVLHEVTGGTYGRVFVADDVMAILDD